MQAELVEDIGADTRRRKRRRKKLSPESLTNYERNTTFEDEALTEHLAVDLAGELIEAFARDYSQNAKDHALAELLFSVKDLKTDYERRAAGAALESLTGRIEAGIREYPNLIHTAETLAEDLPSEATGEDSERASHVARTVIRPIAAELSKRTR